MTGSANYMTAYCNGVALTANGEVMSRDYTLAHVQNKLMPFNLPAEQYGVGMVDPKGAITGYRKTLWNALNAHNLLSPNTDPELFLTMVVGNNAVAQAGDTAYFIVGSRSRYDADPNPGQPMDYKLDIIPHGKRPVIGWLFIDSTAKGTVASTPFDTGSAITSTNKGAAFLLDIHTPTGVQATGTITIASNPADGDTVTIGGVPYTLKSALTPTAGQVLIGATAAATISNLWAAVVGGDGAGTTYAAGTPTAPSTASYSLPVAGVITVTYLTSGTAGNSFTLAKTGTAIAVSGATLTGGVAGETATITVASATTSGGSYTTIGTFTSDGTVRKAEYLAVAAGVTINRWLKVTATLSGSTQNFGFSVIGNRIFNY